MAQQIALLDARGCDFGQTQARDGATTDAVVRGGGVVFVSLQVGANVEEAHPRQRCEDAIDGRGGPRVR
eukprot:628346-Pyramimonas_sp.AAC.1